MRTIRPGFRFRGDRDFVNSASIYESVLEHLGEAGYPAADGPLRFRFREFAQEQLSLHYAGADAVAAPTGVNGDFRITAGGRPVYGWFRRTGEPIEERTPYEEAIMARQSEVDGDVLRVRSDRTYSAIQVVTSSTRRLHDALLPPRAGTKWLCVGIDLPRPLDPGDADDVTIAITRRVGDLLTRSTMSRGGRDIGCLSFSLAER